MATKTFKSRIQNKHDTEAHWNAAVNFKPLAGELIIYDEDNTHSTPRFKVGDGNTLVNNLPFYPSGDVTAAGNNTFTGTNTFSKEAFTVNSNYDIAAIEVTKTGTTTIRSGIDNNCYIGFAAGTLNINNTSGSGTINITAGTTQGLNVSLGANSNALKFNSNDGLKLTTYDFNLVSIYDTNNKYAVKLNCGYHLSPATDPAGSYVDPGLTINDNTVSTKYRGGKIENIVSGTTYSLTLPQKAGTVALTSDLPVANSGTGTTALTSLKIGDTIYSIPKGDVTAAGNNTFTGTNTFQTETSGNLYRTLIDQNGVSVGGGIGISILTDTTYGYDSIKRSNVHDTYTYAFPNKSGTFALTSDIPSTSNFVTLAGTNTFTGNNIFTGDFSRKTRDSSGVIYYKESISDQGFTVGVGGTEAATNTQAIYGFGSIKVTAGAAGTGTLSLPVKTGTLALTSDIPIKTATLSGTTLSITLS